jgi:hypothetical protein
MLDKNFHQNGLFLSVPAVFPLDPLGTMRAKTAANETVLVKVRSTQNTAK